jgi:DNA-binding MarR family transcriptional regulator
MKLAELTVTERTALARNLTVLRKKGFIVIKPGSDRRERQVAITEQGQKVLVAAIQLWKEAQARIEKGLGENRMERLLKDLSEFTALARVI